MSSNSRKEERTQAYLEGRNSQLTVRPPHSVDSWFNGVWLYVTVAFANVIFQGLLSMHALLDNPYGDHCCKFPLRAQVTEVLNTTRTLLCKADVLPSMFSDIFESNSPSSQAPQRAHSAAAQVRLAPLALLVARKHQDTRAKGAPLCRAAGCRRRTRGRARLCASRMRRRRGRTTTSCRPRRRCRPRMPSCTRHVRPSRPPCARPFSCVKVDSWLGLA